MAQKAIREYDGKRMFARWLSTKRQTQYQFEDRFVQINPNTDLESLKEKEPWVTQTKLVAKPDQLIKRRGKLGLVLLDATWDNAQTWLKEQSGKEIKVDSVSGVLDHFLVEPFTPHTADEEYYLAIRAHRDGDEILYYHEGGVDVGDVDQKAERLDVVIGNTPTTDEITRRLLGKTPEYCRSLIAGFIQTVFIFYSEMHYTYLEMNPFIVVGDKVMPLDLAARIDDTADFVCRAKWGELNFPAPFGRTLSPEEHHIAELDSKTGASLKLTILNPKGRVWTMVAGGGASVIYTDTVSDLGFGEELANYGEYSGDPSEEFTYGYARTILDLMTREKDPRGKVLIVGGGIANFTNVATTFKGIVRAFKEFRDKLVENEVRIYVRRGGPNYQEGLRIMRELGETLGVPIEVYGPETHITSIVPMALQETAAS